MKKYRIVCLGDNCVDYYDETGTPYFGGNPVNVAVYVSRLGGEAAYLGAVGTDSFGTQMKEAIAQKGVDVSHVQVQEGRTALTHVTIRDGDRVFGDYEEGVMADFRLREEDHLFISRFPLAVSGVWGHCENDLARIQDAGVTVAFDASDALEEPAVQIAIPHKDILFLSDDKSDDASLKSVLAALWQQGPSIVVATRGEKGSMAFDGQVFYEEGIVPCKVVDTMGAGDSFIAGFLMKWLEMNRTEDVSGGIMAGTKASAAGAIPACMRAGAESSAVTLGYAGAW